MGHEMLWFGGSGLRGTTHSMDVCMERDDMNI